MPSSQSERAFFVGARPVPVQRVAVQTTEVDHNYARVELAINGTEYEFSGPDAQVLGATLNTAGGGDMFERSKREDELQRQVDVMREASARLKPLARNAATGVAGTRTELDEAIAWIVKGCPKVESSEASLAH